MNRIKMHADEVETSTGLVRGLLSQQFPQWADLPIKLVPSYGTDHDIYRLGERLCIRMPRIGWASGQAEREVTWLPRLAPHLPLLLPVHVTMGQPAGAYPFTWSIWEWLPGDNANGTISDLEQAVVDLVGFITAMRRIDTTDAPPRARGARGGKLTENDEQVRRAVAELGDRVDGAAVIRAWEESLTAPPWDRDVWVHGDLLPGNLLVDRGRLSAVIDWGGLNVGDPACDLQPAWNIFAGRSREAFLSELGVDTGAYLRGRGWTLYQAITGLNYYWDTNPGMVRQVSHALSQVLAEA
ncbi:aminoglycoside phosphotransferase family protein [Streptomyces litchfieldiae]|uniref:Aminoglycoside phosphotransferase family protein n=1 Tax=Streptomyces litchfieldiae TaxID=3075543 RepID=A0ABU2N0W5_9ACTN|nr:aminoglycoside phosphotransferase family protein [Streptomyces sp. DSM 44938]MDT0347524.1 aminoglycoside phosphotransferase family protein [Streptomyces sp. DSM 44938]